MKIPNRNSSSTPIINPLLLCFMLVSLSECQFTITGVINPNQRGNIHQQSLASYGGNDLLRIQFHATGSNPLTTTSLLVNFNGDIQPSSINLQDFYHLDPKDINNYDLDAMWNGRDQYINIYRPNAGTSTLYMTVVNYDPSYRQSTISYTISISSPGQVTYSCDSCSNGESFGSNTNCFCRNCNFQMIGKLCNRSVQKLDKNVSFALTPQVYQYFSIENVDKLTVTIGIQGGTAQAYFQFEQFEGQVASYFNVAKGSTDGRYLINNNELKVGADPQKRKLLITLVSFSVTPINGSISYTVQSSVSVLVIVMAVLGSILLIALIIAVVCIIKKRNATNRVNSEIMLPSDNSKLSGEEIQRYFPICVYASLMGAPAYEESSINQLAKTTQKQGIATEQDCVICLQQINNTDQIRMGYCRHMFHGSCLISWFKKQRNCPYCRKQYNRDETTAEYNKLVAENGNRVLRDGDLVRAIYSRKITSSTLVENIQ